MTVEEQVVVDCGYVNEDDTEDISIQPPPSDVTQMSGAQIMSLQSKGLNVGWAHQVTNLQPCVKYAFDYQRVYTAAWSKYVLKYALKAEPTGHLLFSEENLKRIGFD